MKKLFVITVLLNCAISINTFAQITKEEFKASISIKDLEHPYLFFTNQDKPAIRERIKNDIESKNIMKALLAEGNRFVQMPFEKKKILEPKHPRFEMGNEAGSYLAEIYNGALTLSFLYQITGEEKYVERAIEFAEAISDVSEWRNPAHAFDIIYPRVWPQNVPDDQVVFSYDLNSSRVARILSTVYDWLYPVLTIPQRDKIRNGILEKAVTRVRGNYEFFWWSNAYNCNWSAICYSGLGISALALIKENPQLIDVVAESYNKINLTLDQIGDEGGWQEGRGYFGYMAGTVAYYADALKRVSKSKFNLFNHPKIKTNALDFYLYALTASFGDSEGKSGGQSSVFNKFISETGSKTSAFYREKFIQEGADIYDILWPRSSVKAEEPKEKSRYFKNIDWAILRSDFFDPSAVTIACKAGLNNDPHHGHLDCGQFILTWQNTPFIKDLGRMEYDEKYFNNERYDYVYANSEGHNLISVNNEQQIVAKKKNSEWLENIGGRIIDFRSNEKRDYVLMDPSKAYIGKELKKWRRNIILEKPAVTIILDEVNSEIGSKISARFFPGVGDNPDDKRAKSKIVSRNNSNNSLLADNDFNGFEVMNDFALMSDGKGNRMALIPIVLNNNFKLTEDKIASMLVAKDAKVEWFPYIEAVAVAKESSTLIVTIILPVIDEKDAKEKMKSAKISLDNKSQLKVSVNNMGKELEWSFKKDKDGFVLE